mmetsp:Transcript_64828/g.163296  ORF Transcript_64828/g.163296 Transcript_64828/m.163296 type:complete len:315 (-) Transcript_64828:1748-2692(-)
MEVTSRNHDEVVQRRDVRGHASPRLGQFFLQVLRFPLVLPVGLALLLAILAMAVPCNALVHQGSGEWYRRAVAHDPHGASHHGTAATSAEEEVGAGREVQGGDAVRVELHLDERVLMDPAREDRPREHADTSILHPREQQPQWRGEGQHGVARTWAIGLEVDQRCAQVAEHPQRSIRAPLWTSNGTTHLPAEIVHQACVVGALRDVLESPVLGFRLEIPTIDCARGRRATGQQHLVILREENLVHAAQVATAAAEHAHQNTLKWIDQDHIIVRCYSQQAACARVRHVTRILQGKVEQRSSGLLCRHVVDSQHIL